jgi:hypothetical protein
MAIGYFTVTQDGTNLDIRYQVAPGAQGPCPDDQMALKADIEAVEAALKVLYPDEVLRLPKFRELLSLAAVGLDGPNAAPKIAAAALVSLKTGILLTEGNARKNRYLKQLGKWAVLFGGIPLLLVLCLRYVLVCYWTLLPCVKPDSDLLVHFCLLWIGGMLGAWISYGLRTDVLTFDELVLPEEDRLEPPVRLLFVGTLVLILGLALYIGVVDISFGKISSRDFIHRTSLAILLGVLMGASERALSGQMTKLAGQLMPGK